MAELTGPDSHAIVRWRTDLAIAIVVALAVFAVSRAYALPLVGLHHDDGQYVVAAKALATGQGYRQIHVPGEPPQTKIPILFPWLLSVLWTLGPPFPGNVSLFSSACSAALAASAALVFFAARQRFGVGTLEALTSVLAGFTLPALSGLCAQIMSEAPFLLLVATGLTVLPVREDGRRARWWIAGLAFGLAALTRSIGLFVVTGVVVWGLRSRQRKWGLLLPALALPLAWFAWSIVARATSPVPSAYGTSYEGWLRTVPASAWVGVIRDNLLAVFVHTGYLVSQAFIGLVPAAGRPPLALVAGCLVVVGVVAAARRECGAWAWALGAYTVAAIAWPWPPSRFIVVVLPLALVLVTAALRDVPRAGRALAVAALLVTAANVIHAVRTAREITAASGLVQSGQPAARWSDYDALFGWIHRSTPPRAIVACIAEPMVYLYAERRGVFPYAQRTIPINYETPPSIGTADDLDRLLDETRAAYLVRLPAPPWGHADLLDAVIADLRRERPSRLRRAYVGSDDRFEVLEVVPEKGSGR